MNSDAARLAISFDSCVYALAQFDPAYRLVRLMAACFVLDCIDMPFTVDDAAMLDLFVVVIFACNPEYRHGFNALIAKSLRKLNHSESFVNRIKGPGE